MDIIDFTAWMAATGEIDCFGRAVEGSLFSTDDRKIYWGEKVNPETHIFDTKTELPILRPTPRLISQAHLLIEVNRERDRRLEAGKDFGGIWVTATERDKTNIMALSRMAEKLKVQGVTDAVIPFKDGKNVIHTLTPDQMIDLEDVGLAYLSEIYQASWKLKEMEPLPQDVTSDVHWP